MTTPLPNEDLSRLTLRIPAPLHDEIKRAAAMNGRTVNGEIVERLQAAPVTEQLRAMARENAEMKSMIRQLLILADAK